MGFFAFFNCYTLRVNLSVAIVEMVNTTYLREHEAAAIENSTNSSSIGSSRNSQDACVTDDNTTDSDDKKVLVFSGGSRICRAEPLVGGQPPRSWKLFVPFHTNEGPKDGKS